MSEGFNVVVVGVRANFCLVEGDVRDKADVKKALEGVDVVFHLAAIVSVDFSVKNPLLVNEVNVDGTLTHKIYKIRLLTNLGHSMLKFTLQIVFLLLRGFETNDVE